MATRLQVISELAAQAMEQLTRSVDSWRSFLNSAAWLYKYPFHEQVLTYAQRPDAKACAPIELWNSRFKRWVNRGARGIALIDDSGQKPALRYVFDVSDTNTRYDIPFRLWQTKPEYEIQIIEELENQFGETGTDGSDLTTTVLGISINVVSDNYRDYYEELLKTADDSALADLSKEEISATFMLQLMTSVSHTVLVRLGIDPAEVFHDDEYEGITLFNSPDTIAQFGAATSDISEMILRQIEQSVRNRERQERGTLANVEPVLQNKDRNSERGDEYGTQLQAEWGLLDSQYQNGRSAARNDREIRENAEDVSKGAAERDLQLSAASEQADRASVGDRQDGTGTGRTDRGAHGESRGRDGGAESPRSDEMGGADEQSAAHGGGDRSPRGDLQLTPRFPTEKEQLSLLEQAEDEISSVFSVSQADFDNELCLGSGVFHGKYRIYAFYQTQPSKESAIQFLKKEYGIGGHSHTYLDGSSGFVGHDGKGIEFSDSGFHHKKLFRWNAVHSRLSELIALDRYLSEKEKASLPAYEQEEAQRRAAMREESAAREALQSAAAAMDEKRKDAQYRYSLGDEVQLGTQRYTVLGYDENIVTLSDPKYPLLSEDMPRDVFERRLRENPQNDHLIVENAEQPTKAPQHTEEGTPYVYAVGDTVYLEGTAFRITQITNSEVQLLDPTLLYPVFRAENRETFHHLLEQDERNAPYMPSMPYRTVTEANVREDVPAERSEQPFAIEPTVFYPAEKNNLPFDIELRKLKPASEQKKPIKHDFHITDDNLGHGGAKAKFRKNMDAINTLQTIELENRLATPEEQEVLSRYVGWGGIPQAFEEGNNAWASEFLELYTALSPEEYEAARASTLNAHYTSPTVIKAIYKCIENMGFTTGNVLEPSCGIGNFFGLLPESMKNSKLYGVELDPITGRIARQLYQTANIAIEGFEETSLPDSFFDIAIGNVPFGDYGVADKRYDKHRFLIHDYFFGATRS